jgi:hypothetical protein
MSQPHRLLLKWARFVHVYLTMFGLLIILFFAATGFILNHPEWFDYNEKHKTVVEGSVPTGWLGEEPDKLAIVELLRAKFGARGYMESFDVRSDDMEVHFKSPSSESEAIIRLEEGQKGQMTVTHYSRGVLGLLTDLHRGEASGYHTGETGAVPPLPEETAVCGLVKETRAMNLAG